MLDDLGIDYDDGAIILQREIYRSGRNICRVNGMLVNTSTLKELGETIVDIHGQNEHQELMQPDKHLRLLDEFGGKPVAKLRQDYHTAYDQYQHLHQAMVERNTHRNEWAQRLDMLRFQVSEIDLHLFHIPSVIGLTSQIVSLRTRNGDGEIFKNS